MYMSTDITLLESDIRVTKPSHGGRFLTYNLSISQLTASIPKTGKTMMQNIVTIKT